MVFLKHESVGMPLPSNPELMSGPEGHSRNPLHVDTEFQESSLHTVTKLSGKRNACYKHTCSVSLSLSLCWTLLQYEAELHGEASDVLTATAKRFVDAAMPETSARPL